MLSSLFKSIFPAREKPRPHKTCLPRVSPELSVNVVIQQTGASQLLRADFATIEICDLIVQCQNANNTFQLFAGTLSVSPLLSFTPGQPATFSGMRLNWPDALSIVCGNASPVAVNIRYRLLR